MSHKSARIRLIATAAVLVLSLSACVVYPRRAYYVGPEVAVAPPAPVVETYGVAPVAGYVWLGGYWNWVGGRYAWVRGHWAAPRPGYHWAPGVWARGPGGGWRMTGGAWVRG
jgi:hypothetical protein